MRAGEIAGRPVVTLDAGEDIAEVRDVVFSHDNGYLVGFTLNKRGWLSGPLRKALDWSGVHALGPDAVMVATSEALATTDDDHVDPAGPDAEDVVGGRVITDSGRELGVVTDLVLEIDDQARVVGYEIGGAAVEEGPGADRRYIPLPETFAVSASALIVPASVTGFIRDDLSGFGGAVDDFRAQLEQTP
ncbi:hypothetical protein BH23ACT10_BH23ACT10_16890 [soil metagenome]